MSNEKLSPAGTLRLAIQKSGRLSEESLSLIKECGISFPDLRGSQLLKVGSWNFPIEFLFLRDDDIPEYVADGVADLGIVGENTVGEAAENVDLIHRLGFARCRLSVAVPESSSFQDLSDLAGHHIATSYPSTLTSYLRTHGVAASIHTISGSVEIAPSIGLADAVCDLVSSGSTLMSNGLRELAVVLQSEAVLIGNRSLSSAKESVLQRLLFRMKAVQAACSNKYILLNAPNDRIEAIVKLLPGMKSPTIVPLATAGWSSIHSVVEENEFWDRIESLKAAGAEGILVVPIEKMIH